jgi:hypothetical protein
VLLDSLWLPHCLEIFIHVNSIFDAPIRKLLEVDALAVDRTKLVRDLFPNGWWLAEVHLQIGPRELLGLCPVHRDQVHISTALNHLHEYIDTVVDMYLPHRCPIFCMTSALVIIFSIRNLPEHVETV